VLHVYFLCSVCVHLLLFCGDFVLLFCVILLFCSYFVVLCYFYCFVYTSVGVLPPGESPVAVSSSSSSMYV
jgi:hypothetical protein